MMPSCAAVIVAAGSSSRIGFDKLMAPLGDGTVLGNSFKVFYDCPMVREIVIVTSQDRFRAVIPDPSRLRIPISRVDGGSNRHDSVMAGLMALETEPDLVAVHDGARPLLHPHQLVRCIEATSEYGAAACARPVVDTLKEVDAEGFTRPGVIDRSVLWSMETPQIFRVADLLQAYRKVMEEQCIVTDEVSAMELIGKKTFLVRNSWANPKITLPGDLEIAEAIWRQSQ